MSYRTEKLLCSIFLGCAVAGFCMAGICELNSRSASGVINPPYDPNSQDNVTLRLSLEDTDSDVVTISKNEEPELEFISPSPCLIIGTKRGEMTIHFELDQCVVEDPCGVMDDGARLFFEKYLKDIVDRYIAYRLRGKSQ